MSRENYLVRSEVLASFDDLLQELGADPEPFYHRVGLSAELLANPDHMVPCANVCTLLDITAKDLGLNDLGLMVGGNRKPYHIGVLWPLIAHSPNVEQALKSTLKYLHLHNRGISWQLDIEGDRVLLTRTDRVDNNVPTFQWAVYSTCAMLVGTKSLCGQGWSPSSVEFIHPPPVDCHTYNRFFGVKVEFNREFNCITFPALDLNREIPDRNRRIYNQMVKQIRALEDQNKYEEDFCSKIKLLLEQRIHTADCNQTTIARALEMHPKTLQRELNCRGTTFRELKAEARLDMAERYLKDSEIPLTTVADILGFSELSSFSHAFKARHQLSPSEWRNKTKF